MNPNVARNKVMLPVELLFEKKSGIESDDSSAENISGNSVLVLALRMTTVAPYQWYARTTF